MNKLSRQNRKELHQAEIQARREIEQAAEKGRQAVDELFATASQTLGGPARRWTSWIWIPALGAAVIAGLGFTMFTRKMGPFAEQHTTKTW